MQLQDKLYEEGIKPKSFETGTTKIKCPKCQPPHNAKDRPLSLTIDINSAVWKCHHCDWTGGVKEDYYIKNIKPIKKKPKERFKYEAKTDDFLDKFFEGRHISRETYEAFDIFHQDNYWIGFPYNPSEGKADNIKFRSVDKKFKQTPDAKKVLYNYKNIREANTVIFVEGELDVLSLYECGLKNATTLPDGAPNTTSFKENDKRFQALRVNPITSNKVVLFTDNDTAGKNLHKELLHRFGKDRCWYCILPEGCKDANDVLVKKGKDELKKIVEKAIPYPVDGLYTASSYSGQINDLYNGNYQKPLEIGMKGLDNIYKIMKGTFHVWTGIPNHGKSTFLDQILVNLGRHHDWRFAVFSPEHSTSMHIRRLLQIYNRKPFDKEENERMTPEELENGLTWIQDHFYFIETREHIPNVSKILDISKQACQKFGCNGIIIDPYNEVDASRQGNKREDEHIRDFISSCKRFARMHDVVMWVVAHPTKLQRDNDGTYHAPTAYDIAGASHWHNQSDAVVTVHRDFDDNSVRVITRKIREQGLYGNIGEATFFYNTSKKIFAPREVSIDGRQDWQSNY
jgi:twinkle protein